MHCSRSIHCALFLMVAIIGPAVRTHGAEPATPKDATQQAIADLNTTAFAKREAAEEQLLKLGPAAFEPLLASLDQAPNEAGRRVLKVLEQIWLRTPEPEADRLERRFEDLMLTIGPWQPLIEQMLRSHHALRDARAVRALRRMNAIVEVSVDNDLQLDLIEKGIQGAPPLLIENITLPKSWKGGDEGLWHLGRLFHRSGLLVFVIQNNGITGIGLDRHRAIFPGLIVSTRSEVCLGVVGNTDDIFGGPQVGCLLREIRAGGSADHAGLRPFDRVMSVDGLEINRFQELVETLKEKRAYESSEIIIERGGEILTMNVVLLPWEVFQFPRPPAPPVARRIGGDADHAEDLYPVSPLLVPQK